MAPISDFLLELLNKDTSCILILVGSNSRLLRETLCGQQINLQQRVFSMRYCGSAKVGQTLDVSEYSNDDIYVTTNTVFFVVSSYKFVYFEDSKWIRANIANIKF